MFKKLLLGSLTVLVCQFSFVSLQFSSLLAEETALVVVGYRAHIDGLENPFTDANKDRKGAIIKKLIALKNKSDKQLLNEVKSWEKASKFKTTKFNEHLQMFGMMKTHFHFHGARAHYLLYPMIFIGAKSDLDAALKSIDKKKVGHGEFRALELKETRYIITAIFGYVDQKVPGGFTALMSQAVAKHRNFLTPKEALADIESTKKGLVEFYKNSPEYTLKKEVQLMRSHVVFHALLDRSWQTEGFFLPKAISKDKKVHTKDKVMAEVGAVEEVTEIK